MIINISSDVALRGSYNLPAYAASKAAINLITQIFGIESSDFGITVNALFQPWLKQI